MKKRPEKKLSLSKETLRNLIDRDLQGIFGGVTTTDPCPSAAEGCTGSCESFRCSRTIC